MKTIYVFKVLLLTIIILAQKNSFAQYTVTKIVGQVSNKSTGEKLKPGSRLKDDDMLEFSSERDLVRVIVSGKGVYVISPTPRKSSGSSMIVEMLKSALKIKSREGYLSGRSEDFAHVPEAFETEASVNNLHLILDETRYLFDKGRFNVSSGNRFFLQLDAEGASPEIRPLITVGDTLILTAADFKPRQPASGKMSYKLGFFDKENNRSAALTTIRPYIDTSGEMQTLISLIVDDYENKDPDALRQVCYAEVYESMGKPSKIDFENTFSRLAERYLNQTKK